MTISKTSSLLLCSFIFCFIFAGTIAAQPSSKDFLPKYPVKSAIINYQITQHQSNDSVSHPFLRESFDLYGEKVSKEYIDGLSIQIHGEPYREIFAKGSFYMLDNPAGCATMTKITASRYTDCHDGGFNKQFQDLMNGKINKNNDKTFQSFVKTGSVIFLGLNCTRYEYNFFNFAISSKDKILFLVYHDICLMEQYYLGGNIWTSIEATNFEENIPIPTSVFEVPSNMRIIDGDKLDIKNKSASSGFNTLIVSYKTSQDYGQVKEDGIKTLYIKDNGKTSAQDWESTVSEYGLPPETMHTKKIKADEYEFLVDFGRKTVHRRNLVDGNYNDKSAAELNYIFVNNLYDNTVQFLGNTNFLGKECRMFDIRIGVEKLEVCEWQGVFLKVKKFMCLDPESCPDPILVSEETATQVQVNAPISGSMFQYPEQFELINN